MGFREIIYYKFSMFLLATRAHFMIIRVDTCMKYK